VASLKEILIKALGILVVVNKKREIYYIDNVKFHLDEVDKLGHFVEIEAIDVHGILGKDKLQEQCSYYMKMFQIAGEELMSGSYSDMLLKT
jgi:predicted adenylyl cyclase CyaB